MNFFYSILADKLERKRIKTGIVPSIFPWTKNNEIISEDRREPQNLVLDDGLWDDDFKSNDFFFEGTYINICFNSLKFKDYFEVIFYSISANELQSKHLKEAIIPSNSHGIKNNELISEPNNLIINNVFDVQEEVIDAFTDVPEQFIEGAIETQEEVIKEVIEEAIHSEGKITENFMHIQEKSNEEIIKTVTMEDVNRIFQEASIEPTITKNLENVTIEENKPKKSCTKKKKKIKSIKKPRFDIEELKNQPSVIRELTGLENHQKFMIVFLSLGKTTRLRYKNNSAKAMHLSEQNKLFLILWKLRKNYTDKEMAIFFNTSKAAASNIFASWIYFMAKKWSKINTWLINLSYSIICLKILKKTFPTQD